MIWRCDSCGSDKITQEHQTMILVNGDHVGGLVSMTLDDLDARDFYWCPTCDEECHPIEDKS